MSTSNIKIQVLFCSPKDDVLLINNLCEVERGRGGAGGAYPYSSGSNLDRQNPFPSTDDVVIYAIICTMMYLYRYVPAYLPAEASE